MPPNVRYLGHVPTEMHNRLNCSARLVLNVNRKSMADYGFSPPTRVFEAAGAAACLVSDRWNGIESFITKDSEVLVATIPADVAYYVKNVVPEQARSIGRRALHRVLSQHTYAHRGQQLQRFLPGLFA